MTNQTQPRDFPLGRLDMPKYTPQMDEVILELWSRKYSVKSIAVKLDISRHYAGSVISAKAHELKMVQDRVDTTQASLTAAQSIQ
jgi:hypothetical protein